MTKKRVVKTYRDTSASGDRSPITGHRYFLRVDLVSMKAEEKRDITGKTTEFYIKCGGKGAFKMANRCPNLGTINLERNEVFKPTDGLTIFSGFYEKKGGGTVELPFEIYDQDLGKDDKLVDTVLSITLGQSREYLAFNEKGVKVKIALSANRTRY